MWFWSESPENGIVDTSDFIWFHRFDTSQGLELSLNDLSHPFTVEGEPFAFSAIQIFRGGSPTRQQKSLPSILVRIRNGVSLVTFVIDGFKRNRMKSG